MIEMVPFELATPAMIVGRSFDGSTAPLGLGEPFALLGGHQLGPDGIPIRIMHDHQPAFRQWIAESCKEAIAEERPWFRGSPIMLVGPPGAGRTHAARWLSRVVGVQHAILNLSDPLIASNIAASRSVTEAVWALPITIAMAAARCANPIVTVVGTEHVSDDVLAGFMTMVDPDSGLDWSEDQLKTTVDLSEVTWILQCDPTRPPPTALRRCFRHVTFEAPPANIDSLLALSIMLEAMGDLGIDPTNPAYTWARICGHLPHGGPKAKQLYASMIDALKSIQSPHREDVVEDIDSPLFQFSRRR